MVMFQWLFVLFSVILGYRTDDSVETVKIQTPLGQIIGVNETYKETGEPIYEFRGIPYAKPPVGPLRFKKPEPFGKWKDTLDATSYGKACLQVIPDFMREEEQPEISEDCLTLNVWIPKALGPPKSLSVMVWIHGGGFEVGYGNQDMRNSPRFVMEGNVILVTFNYRLGLFGFFALDHPAARGNYALWDQKLALQWVHDNIEAFGGDPESVTIFGESAGAYSTSLQSLIPSNKGLFRRVICESGVHSKVLMRKPKEIRDYAKDLSDKSGCSLDDEYKFVDCLRDTAAEKLNTLSSFYDSVPADRLVQEIFFKSHSYPVVDGELFPVNPILKLQDVNSDVTKFFRSLDFLAGVTSNEGSLMTMIAFPEMQEHYGFNMTEAIPHKFVCEALIAPFVKTFLKNDNKVKQQICNFYKEERSPVEQSRTATHALADIMFNYPTVRMLEYHLGGKGRTYQYQFSRISPEPFGGPFPDWFEGVGHGDELLFLFRSDDYDLTEEEKKLSYAMTMYWTSFAKTGYPNGGNTRSATWVTFDTTGRIYLDLDVEITMRSFYKQNMVEFWSQIYPQIEIEESEVDVIGHDEL